MVRNTEQHVGEHQNQLPASVKVLLPAKQGFVLWQGKFALCNSPTNCCSTAPLHTLRAYEKISLQVLDLIGSCMGFPINMTKLPSNMVIRNTGVQTFPRTTVYIDSSHGYCLITFPSVPPNSEKVANTWDFRLNFQWYERISSPKSLPLTPPLMCI